MHKRAKIRRRTACLAATALLLASCSKLTPENFDRLESGMNFQQVKQIIGEPDRCTDLLGARTCVWEEDSKRIDIKFIAGKLVLRSSRRL